MGHNIAIIAAYFSQLRSRQPKVNGNISEKLIRNSVKKLVKRCFYDK